MGYSVEYGRSERPEMMVTVCFDDLALSMGAPVEVTEASKRREFSGGAGQWVEAFPTDGPRWVLLGLGAKGALTTHGVRQAMMALAKVVRTAKVGSVVFDGMGDLDTFTFGQAAGEALGLSTFSTKTMLGRKADSSNLTTLVSSNDSEFDKGIGKGLALAKSANLARSLANTPPNIATPGWMASQAEVMAAETGLTIRVIEGDELETEQLTGLMTVGKASENKPCLIRLEWRPEGTEGDQPVVLLGKTITYDTGGLSIKSKTGMPGMKYDKCGGCAVMGAMHAVATVVKPSFPVVGLLVAAENSINENAYRPDDVIRYRNGVSVEVTNTDAEGRLVLADGLCWAQEVEKARSIVDLATLTGGVVTALGSVYAGMFSRQDWLATSLAAAGEEAGERLWRLPLHDSYRLMMDSTVADIVNSVPGGTAHPVQGATFLAEFVDWDTDWAHLDIAGVAKTKSSTETDEGPTGFGVRLLANWLETAGL